MCFTISRRVPDFIKLEVPWGHITLVTAKAYTNTYLRPAHYRLDRRAVVHLLEPLLEVLRLDKLHHLVDREATFAVPLDHLRHILLFVGS